MNFHGIENEKVIFQDEGTILIECLVPAESDFFDGHFPEFKLLPAVGQFAIVTRFAQKYFGAGEFVPSVKRMKFSSPVLPGSCVRLELHFDRKKESVSFALMDAKDENTVYSSGLFCVALK